MANLTVTASGLTICPGCIAAKIAWDTTHQVPGVPISDTPPPRPVAEELIGGTVVDLYTPKRSRAPSRRPQRRTA